MQEQPDILLSSHGRRNHKARKIPRHTHRQQNRTSQLHSGGAIAVRNGIQREIGDDFNFSDTLSAELMTTPGPLMSHRPASFLFHPQEKHAQCPLMFISSYAYLNQLAY